MKRAICHYDQHPAQWWVVTDDGFGYPMCDRCKERVFAVYVDRLTHKEMHYGEETERKVALQFRANAERGREANS